MARIVALTKFGGRTFYLLANRSHEQGKQSMTLQKLFQNNCKRYDSNTDAFRKKTNQKQHDKIKTGLTSYIKMYVCIYIYVWSTEALIKFPFDPLGDAWTIIRLLTFIFCGIHLLTQTRSLINSHILSLTNTHLVHPLPLTRSLLHLLKWYDVSHGQTRRYPLHLLQS